LIVPGAKWGKPSSQAETTALQHLAKEYHDDAEVVEEWNRLIEARETPYTLFKKMTLASYQ
jgi:hypothetical protein